MSEKQEAIERLQALELRNGGSHEMLSSIAKAIYEPTYGGWTIGACQVLRDTLIKLLSETDGRAAQGESIADERRFDNEMWQHGYDEGWDAGFASAYDWLGQHEDAMAEHGWVRLPVDAEGKPIRIGDVMEWCDSGETLTVEGIGRDVLFYIDGENAEWTAARNKRHHHEPTVEDVLRDMHAKLDEVTALYVGEAIDSDERDGDEARIFAEYATKLRLAGDAE